MASSLLFQMPRQLRLGNGSLSELANSIAECQGTRVLVVTDPGLVKAGIVERVLQELHQAAIASSVFDAVEPDPRIELVQDCVAAAKASGADLLIGLGGGSALDIAKVAAVISANDTPITDMVGIDRVPARGLPVIAMPTTAGTGSEVTPIAVLSDKQAHLKKGIVSQHLIPDVALIDPDLMLSLPAHITASTGIDALTHAIEAYTNKHAQAFIDPIALEAIRLIGQWLPVAVRDGGNREARYHMALASCYGGMCLGPVNTAAVHALAYPLGGTYDVPHGVANALLLPFVMRFNLPAAPHKYAAIAAALGEDCTGLDPLSAAECAVKRVQALCQEVGIISRLRELDIPADAIDAMADSAMQVTRLLNNNPREVSRDDARAIYQNAW